MKRRYEQKDDYYKVWNDHLIKYQSESVILNPGNEGIPDENTVILDTVNVKLELLRRIGDQKGNYKRGGGFLTADIPFFENKLKEVEVRWELYKQQRLNMGYNEPTEYPKHLLDLKLKMEAKLDIINKEVDILSKKLSEIREVEDTKTDGEVLQYGCVASCHFWGTQALTIDMINVLKEIDNQRIGQTSSGLLIIRDERSPYNGCSVADYRGTICNEFLQARKSLDRERLKKLKALAREEGLPVPHQLSPRGPVKVSKSSLPKWPEGIRNYLTEPENETEDSSGSIMKRTKKSK